MEVPDRNEVKVRSYRPYPGTTGTESPIVWPCLTPDPSRLSKYCPSSFSVMPVILDYVLHGVIAAS
jgi:hypothetical protein